MGNKLYVGSLPFAMTDGELQTAFQPYGNVVSARIILDKISGRSKGFGFVEFDNEESASKAMTAMNQSEIGGRKIMVNVAHPQKDSGSRGGGGGGGRGFGGGRPGGNRGGGFNRDRGGHGRGAE